MHSLETIFLHSGIHEYVNLDKHYSLCHNDFHWRNLHHYDGKCTIFDWGTYSYGMRGWDMAVYFSDGEFSFEEIYECILIASLILVIVTIKFFYYIFVFFNP